MRRTTDIVFWLAASLWLSLALVGGLAAMAIFPAARDLPLSMEGYEPFVAEHATLGRQLVAGHLVERVFAVSTAPRFALAVLAAVAILLQLGRSARPPLFRLRLSALALAALALSASTFVLLPRFQAADREYRAAARKPETIPEALAQKSAVDAAHEDASRAATLEVVALLALIGLSAAAGSGASRRG
ncbi:MAG: hypothetical protein RL325_623 [Planctomycetota bacterium]|jgi:hypothetical protein